MDTADWQLRELLDKQAITEVIYRYARSMDRLDRELGRVEAGDAAVVEAEHKGLVRLIDRAVVRGALHKNAS